ncbi:MAG: hypothetical protein J7604_21460 [Sporocytophaga sp.]|uniref:hypothetical protein n=1 Tax=Sporocytophaga sp. TaxID=2231183 RepID=UPI001B2F2A12|nr:hypothetical protein [Sporocytophaga sp.]MBO9702795.1 hypothetical protein [Sporocytophaga sp.]
MYFRKTEIHFPELIINEAENSFLQKSDEVNYMFDLHQTIGWILPSNHFFIRKKIKDNEYIISRYRHIFFVLLPRVVTKVKFEKTSNGSKITFRTRLSINSFIAFFFLTLFMLFPIVGAVTHSRMIEMDDFSETAIFMFLYLIISTFWESIATEKLVHKIIIGLKIKNIFSA